ncbi:G-type lectin S-receptor-like serine/threonine-protein kinase At1g11410 [Panicum virgatum]|nr:G-type lectin S-receptor-like serine/threonine-protein kinase At1g11410 [Panicum virgatum]
MSYNHPVPFHDNGGATTTTALPQVASFSTSFTFVIKLDGEPAPGDGLAFFLCGYPSRMPANTDGGSLGLMDDDATAYGSGQFVAVEFDTYKNDDWGDPSDDHIGVDVNTVRSSNTTELNTTPSSGLPPMPISLKANATMTATILFDGATGMLAASLGFHDHPFNKEPAVVTYVLQDPKSLLPQEVAVGFSAGTGTSTQLHQILAWSFDSTLAAPMTPPKGWQNVNYAGHKSMVVAIAVVVPILALFICGIVSFKIIKKNRKGEVNVKEEDEALVWVAGRSSEFMVYNFLQVLEATNNFSEENKLGQGGFGPVYKGRFRDGSEIAAKRLASHSGQGFREFKNEIELIAKLQHTNLVRLLGCCCQGDERLLIYEYMPHKSLDFYIFDEIQRVLLDWNKRLAIIEGIAQGILYLHKHSRLRVIHRDLKASNILLDHEMNPKISDFGLAKIFSLNGTEGNTNRIVGTYGYMAPEYASEGLFSIKSDVFSFGVLTLEIISGKRTSNVHQYGDFINLLGYAWQLWVDGLGLQLVDTSLGAQRHALMMMRCINIALLCVQENAVDRPTMSEVAAMLCSDSITLPEPKHPAYFHVRVGAEEEASAETSGVNDVTISAIDGR